MVQGRAWWRTRGRGGWRPLGVLAVAAIALLLGGAQIPGPSPLPALGQAGASPGPVPRGDYGDAPDGLPAGYSGPFADVLGRFPTLYDTARGRAGAPGAYALEVPLEEAAILGDEISWEADANDPNDPDRTPNLILDDFNDGVEIDPPATLVFKVNVGPEAPDTTRYINVLIDLDRSGAWDGEEEWVIKNLPVDVPAGTSQGIAQALPQEVLEALVEVEPPSAAWMRVALTPTPIDETVSWDGSGEFSSGEIEDYPVIGVKQGDLAVTAASVSAQAAAGARASAEAAAEAQAAAMAAVEAIAEAEAEASAKVTAIAEAEAEVQAYVEATAKACADAGVWIEEWELASAPCYDHAKDLKRICTQAKSDGGSVTRAANNIPCSGPKGDFRTVSKKIEETCTTCSAEAEARASAIAEAIAAAESFAEACGEARATAEAAAEAYAKAQATAEARAEAIAEAKAAALAAAAAASEAAARAQAAARSAATAAAQATAALQETGISLAFGTQIEQTLESLALATTGAMASAITASEAAASAFAQAQAAALAAVEAQARAESVVGVIAEAEAQAEAAVQVATEASARAEAIASAIASAATMTQAICQAEAEARCGEPTTRAMGSLKSAVSGLTSGNCPREICRLDPPPVTITVTTTTIEKECEEECEVICGGYEECWIQCIVTECEDVEEEISGIEILVNGKKYKTPFTIQLEMKTDVTLQAPSQYTSTTISIWPPAIIITTYGFSHWECDGSWTKNRHYGFTINGDITCKAVYGSE